MASLPYLETAVPEETTTTQEQYDDTGSLAVDLVSIGNRTLNFSNKNQTVDNIGIEWPNHNELLTRLVLDWGFFIDVDQLDENAIIKIGIFVPSELPFRVCPMIWNHDIDPKMLRGTIWYWNLKEVRRREICMTASPTTVKPNYGSRSEVHIGSSIGAYKDYNGSLHFVVDNKDLGVAVEKIPRNVFYGWIRIGNNGQVKITHRIDLSFGNYSRRVLTAPSKDIQPQSPSKTSNRQKKPSSEAKKENKKGKEKAEPQSSQNGQQLASAKAVAHKDERAEKPKPYVYSMTKKPRGHCLIISNSKFHDRFRNREGADADEKALKSLFTDLYFKVTIKKNLTAREMEDQLYEHGKKDPQDFDAFVCVIMTHGTNNNVLLGVDDHIIRLEDLMAAVKPTNCRSLQGKPKFFIVQACRGDSREDVAGSYCPGSTFASINSSRSHIFDPVFDMDAGLADFDLSSDSTLPRSMCPIEGDFLLAYATTPGYVALRDPKKGSIFVQVLIEVFRKNHNDYDVLNLLVMVNKQVAERVEELTDGTFWQIPALTCTLRAEFYLRN